MEIYKNERERLTSPSRFKPGNVCIIQSCSLLRNIWLGTFPRGQIEKAVLIDSIWFTLLSKKRCVGTSMCLQRL